MLGDCFYLGHMHEIPHGLGLRDGSFAHAASAGTPASPALPSSWASLEVLIGRYRCFVGAPTDDYRNETFGYPKSPMMIDIAALQCSYGADFSTNATDSVYRWNTATGEMTISGVGQGVPGANRVFLTIWDGGGNDTLTGAAGNDTLEGGVGNDLLPGGAGADRFHLGAPDGSFDRIKDVVHGSDWIEVSAAHYDGLLTPASLAQFVYVPATGALKWDADGAGGAASVTVAMLTGTPLLQATDFVVVA